MHTQLRGPRENDLSLHVSSLVYSPDATVINRRSFQVFIFFFSLLDQRDSNKLEKINIFII